MKINNIAQSNMINTYKENIKKVSNANKIEKMDTVEISAEGKNLSSKVVDKSYESSATRLENIKSQISSGTYKLDAKLIAQKMIDNIKGRAI